MITEAEEYHHHFHHEMAGKGIVSNPYALMKYSGFPVQLAIPNMASDNESLSSNDYIKNQKDAQNTTAPREHVIGDSEPPSFR